MHGTRRDGMRLEFVGVNIFGVRDEQFVWGPMSPSSCRTPAASTRRSSA